jgi:endonuclease YncB( thermonuclease family)
MKGSVHFVIFIIFLFPVLSHAEWQARVVHVLDGDTLITSRGGRGEIIRLFGIDCPEREQAFGPEAASFTSGMVTGKLIRVIPVKVKESTYELCKVYVGDKLLNEEILAAGYAWLYKEYSTNEEWAQLEQTARVARKGLWSQENPVPPWEFRGPVRKHALDRTHTFKFQGKHESYSIPSRPTPARRRK